MKRSKPRIDSRPRDANVTTFVPSGNRPLADLPRSLARAVKLGVDAVEVDFDLGMEPRGKRLLLPVGRRIAGVAVDQGRQSRGIDTAGKKRRGLGRRQVDPVRDVAMTGREIIFAIDDDRAVEHLAQEQARRTAAAVGDDQVRPQVRHRLDRVVDRLALVEIMPVDLRPGNAFARSDARPTWAPGAARAP